MDFLSPVTKNQLFVSACIFLAYSANAGTESNWGFTVCEIKNKPGKSLKRCCTCCTPLFIFGQMVWQVAKKKLATYIFPSNVLSVMVLPSWLVKLKAGML